MKLQQLRYLCEVIDSGLSVSKAAAKLHTVPSGISKQLKLLEDEIGLPLLQRNSTRITGISKAGAAALPTIRRILKDIEHVRRISSELVGESKGQLTVATTHNHARYALVPALRRFVPAYPGVELQLRQGTPEQISKWVLSGEVDVGIGTAPLGAEAALIKMPCYQLKHSVIVRRGHPLSKLRRLTLEEIAKYPLIANYPDTRVGRMVEEAFSAKGIDLRVVIRATDSRVIKKYVGVGFGIAVLPSVTVNRDDDPGLQGIPASHLFKPSTACVIIVKGQTLPAYGQAFIRMVMKTAPDNMK